VVLGTGKAAIVPRGIVLFAKKHPS
jgi:hypothetical protein